MKMHKIIAIIILVMMTVAAAAQSSYTVLYKHLIYVDSNGRGQPGKVKAALYVMGDTMTIYRLSLNEKDLFKKLDLSSTDAHHGRIRSLNKGYCYEIVHNQPFDCYIKVPKDTSDWQIMPNDTLTILGIKCVAAIKPDVVLWYAPSMPIKSGPLDYFGLPGLVLAAYNSRYSFVYTAIQIIPSVPEIVTTKQTRVVSLDEYWEMRKKAKGKAESWFWQK